MIKFIFIFLLSFSLLNAVSTSKQDLQRRKENRLFREKPAQLFESSNLIYKEKDLNKIETYPLQNTESNYWAFNSMNNTWENNEIFQIVKISLNTESNKAYDLVVSCPNYIDGIFIRPIINKNSFNKSQSIINTKRLSLNHGLMDFDWSEGQVNDFFNKESIDRQNIVLISGMFNVDMEIIIYYHVEFNMKALSQRTYTIQYDLIENNDVSRRINRSHLMRRKK